MTEAATKAVALWVVRRLRRAGFQALLAGGCVRDMLLGRSSADYDVATDATPRQVKRLFPRVLLVGAKFGVAMVLRGRRKVEVATFRSDLSYSDGRRPDGVMFSSPREDALRRDFTINGMFYDPIAGQVIDYVGGREDLRRGVIRTIGSPDRRFAEDYLRMLRAVRFAVRLGFGMDADTAAAIGRHAHRIASISGERVFDELSKMLAVPSAGEALRKMEQLGLARHVVPEFFPAEDANRHGAQASKTPAGGGAQEAAAGSEGLWALAVRRVEAVAGRKDLTLALAALLADLDRRMIAAMVRRWGASNQLRDALVWLAGHRDDWSGLESMPLAAFRRLAGHPQFPRLRALWAVRERQATGQRRSGRLVARRLREIPGGVALPPPLVTGDDLLAMGLREGPALGRVLRGVYDAQLDMKVLSRREALALAERLAALRP